MTKLSFRYLTFARPLAAGAALLVVACGGETNVLTRHDGDGNGGMTDVDGGDARGNAGKAGHGAGGSSGSHGDGTAGAVGAGGGALGTDGGAQVGATGGSSGATSSEVDAAALDPHAMERASVVSNFCALLGKYPCLQYPTQNFPQTVSGAAAVTLCNQVEQVNEWMQPCFDEWAAQVRCLAAVPRTCPCTGGDCDLWLNGRSPSPCASQDAAINACLAKAAHPAHQTKGKVGTCHWQLLDTYQCRVDCYANEVTLSTQDDPVSFTSQCNGPPNGPQSCNCIRNGVTLANGPLGNTNILYGNDCADISQQVSDGKCEDVLDCCFTWFTIAEPGHPSVEQCSCVSDPMDVGLSSCDAVAAQGGGKVVNICPQYVTPIEAPF